MSKLLSYQKQFQELLDKGIDTAEIRHKRMVTRPFDFAEKLEKEAKSYSFKSVRQAHNQYAKSLYSSLRDLNGRANTFASDLISRLDKKAPQATAAEADSKPATKKSSSRKTSTAKKASSSQSASGNSQSQSTASA